MYYYITKLDCAQQVSYGSHAMSHSRIQWAMSRPMSTGGHTHRARNVLGDIQSRSRGAETDAPNLTRAQQITDIFTDQRHRDTELSGLSLKQIKTRHARVYSKNRRTSVANGMNADNISALRTANASFNARLNIINPDAVPLKGSLDIAGRPLKQTRLGEKFAETRVEPAGSQPGSKKKKEKKTREKKVKESGSGLMDSLTPKIQKWFKDGGPEMKFDNPSGKSGFTKGLNMSFNKMMTPALKKQFLEMVGNQVAQQEGTTPFKRYLIAQIKRLKGQI